MIYVGVTRLELNKRWRPEKYRTTSLLDYIEKYGWDNIKHCVVAEYEDKESAYKEEDRLIKYYTELGVCINKIGSGLVTYDEEYDRKSRREYYKKNREEITERKREYQREYYRKHKKKKIVEVQMKIIFE